MDSQSNSNQSGGVPLFTLSPAVKHLIIWNVIIFLVSTTPGIGRYVQVYGPLYPVGSPHFYPWQFVSYMFLHGGFGHIIFNMIALWFFGPAVEFEWGTKRFVIYYFITGIGAGITHVIVYSQPVLVAAGVVQYISTIGASGAIYGILLAFGMLFPNRRIILLFPPIPMKAKYFVAIFGAFELFNGITGREQGIAHFSHLGGMLFGFILIKIWDRRKKQTSLGW